MSSISQFLPEPKHTTRAAAAAATTTQQEEAKHSQALVSSTQRQSSVTTAVPEYGKRKGWVPRTDEDYGDGGAYPEIHVAQYPMGLGRKGGKSKSNALAKQVDAAGNIRYDAIAQHGRRSNETVQSQFKDLIPLRQRKGFDDTAEAIPDRPDAQTVKETSERTQKAIDKIMGKTTTAATGKPKDPTYVRYTADRQEAGFNSGASQRIVKISQTQTDPLEPPKFKHKRVPQAPPSPPPPVMHSPPRKVSAEEQREWTVPPCVSNWKNMRGFTVALDKRLATEGRGLDQIQVGDGFARLSEALMAAERNARDEIGERARMRQNIAKREKEAKEEKLRMLAQKAREERARVEESAGIGTPVRDAPPDDDTQRRQPVHGRKAAVDFFDADGASKHREDSNSPASDAGTAKRKSRYEDSDSEEERARDRDRIRRERRKERERELRLNRAGGKGGAVKAKHLRVAESRDVSEKIALGIARPSAGREAMFDARLFNQPSASNSALQNDEAYNLYDKPLFSGSSAASYRPRGAVEEERREEDVRRMMESDRFGTQLAKQDRKPGPVEFEKGDVFGISEFVDSAAKHGATGNR